MGKGSGKCNDRGVEKQVEPVPRAAAFRAGFRHVESGKEGNRTERAHDQAHDGKTGEKKLQALAETNAAAEDESDHSVEQSVQPEGKKDDGGELERDPASHFPPVSEPDRKSVGSAAQDYQDRADPEGVRPASLDPGREEVPVTAAEVRDRAEVGGSCGHSFSELLCDTK